ncbi:MAG: hypothetical protein K1Y01_04655 [Vicinamibacteria bacterium]|nr:hypothetical protein [Vicinamibacteria bacterium]
MKGKLLSAALVMTVLSGSADAGELGVFLTLPTPTETWKTGFGFHAAVISLPFLQAGGEWARVSGENSLLSISTYTAQAEFNPPSLKVSPFVGVGAGAYHQNNGSNSDWGTLTAIFGGLRVPIGVAKLRAEFRKVSLSGTPRANIDKRFSLGVSFRF